MAAMNSMVTPAVTTPSKTHVSSAERLNVSVHALARIRTINPAHAKRSHATPSAPSCSDKPMDTARPACTHNIDAMAIAVPARAVEPRREVLMGAVHSEPVVHVHATMTNNTFMKRAQ
jgi:hypothetical protein